MQLRKNIAVSDTGFVFNPTTGDSYSINQVGQEILKLLPSPALIIRIIRVLEFL